MSIRVQRYDVSFQESSLVSYRLPGFSGAVVHLLNIGTAVIREKGFCDTDDTTRAAVLAGRGDPSVLVPVVTPTRGTFANCYLADASFPGSDDTLGASNTGSWTPLIPYERVWVQVATGSGS